MIGIQGPKGFNLREAHGEEEALAAAQKALNEAEQKLLLAQP